MEFYKRLVSLLFVAFFFTGVAHAGSFSDSFKEWVLGPEAQASVPKSQASRLDEVTTGCMQCHNGANASHVTVKTADSPMLFTASGQQANHPVGMNYRSHASRSPAEYKNPEMLDSNIMLVNGQVACVSCHLPKTQAQANTNAFADFSQTGGGTIQTSAVQNSCTSSNKLTVGTRKTDLCLACHNM